MKKLTSILFNLCSIEETKYYDGNLIPTSFQTYIALSMSEYLLQVLVRWKGNILM